MKRKAPTAHSLPPKRLHTDDSAGPSHVPITFSDLSDELCIQIFAQLSHGTLVNAMLVSRDWCRLTRDNQLWKQLFLRDHSPLHLKSVSTSGRGRRRAHDPYRPIRPLPSRALNTVTSVGVDAGSSLREEGPLDWRWMYRLSSNWASGHCVRSQTALVVSQSDGGQDGAARSPRCPTPSSRGAKSLPFAQSLLHLLGVYVLAASPESSKAEVYLSPSSHSSSPFDLVSTVSLFPSQGGSVTVLQPDADPTTGVHRFAAFSSRGWISIHSLPTHPSEGDIDSPQTHTYVPPGGVARSITAAAFHSPLLATLNSDFTLHIYHVPHVPSSPLSSNEPTPLRLLHTLRSFTSFPPASLSFSFPSPTSSPLSTRSHPYIAKLTLHNLVPAYPSHWVPTSHQFDISLPSSPSAPDAAFAIVRDQSWSIGGWMPGVNASSASEDEESSAERERNRRVRKLVHVGGIAGNAKVVYVAGDSALHVHRLKPSSPHLHPALTLPLPPSVPRGTSILALAADPHSPRCVASLSSGEVVVWDVEAGNEGTVLPGLDEGVGLGEVREVRFDEGRVVGVGRGAEGEGEGGRLVVWDFDC